MTEGWLGVEVVPRGPPLTRYRGSSPQGEPKPNVNRRGGFHIRPCNLAQPRNCQEGSRPLPTNQLVQLGGNVRFLGRMQASAPTATESCVLVPEGSIGEETKSVKKRAALLHVLAFWFFDHPFGVPRGEQPLGRGSLPRNSETFFASFFGHKKGRSNGRSPLK